MKAMVLSAGYGTRLGDLTRNLPKPMLPLHGRPLLEYIIRHLARHDFRQIAVNLHFMPEAICDHFGDGSDFGVELVYSYEPVLLGTAGGVKQMADFLSQDEMFLVHYGDVLTDQDFMAMVEFHRAHDRPLATLLLHRRARSNSIVSLDENGRIIGFLERPGEEARCDVQSPWVNSGVYLCDRRILEHIPPGVACDFPRDIFPNLIAEERLYGFPLSGYRCAIDSLARYEEAQAAIADGRYRQPFSADPLHHFEN